MQQNAPPDPRSARLLKWALVLSAVFIAVIVPSFPGHGYDAWCWREWTIHIQRQGLQNAYGSGTDYPPVMQYVLWVFGWVMGTPVSVVANYPYLRLLTYAVDLAGVYLVWRWSGKPAAFVSIALFSLLNIASSYNTVIWGQVDGILATLVCAALYTAWKERLTTSGVLMTVALLFKLQAIVFVPLWGLLMLGAVARLQAWRRILPVLFAIAVTATIILLPFMLTTESRGGLADAIFGSVGRYPQISASASNWWQFAIYRHTGEPDYRPWIGGLSYQAVGLLIFCATSAIGLWPLLLHTLRQARRGREGQSFPREKLWLTAALLAVGFLFWLTQMHERYSHPALIFLLAFALYTRDWIPYLLFCITYFLNLENILQALKLKNYDTALFDPRTGAVIYALLIVYLFARLYGWKGFARRAPKAESDEARRQPTVAQERS